MTPTSASRMRGQPASGPFCRSGPGAAFTLVELLIVVVILGILAAIVVPQFSDAAGDAKLNALTSTLQVVRKQLEVYKAQHQGIYPKLSTFQAQMTGKTNVDGTTTGSPTLGPYLRKIPTNPFMDATIGSGGVGTTAWYYNENTGEFRANCHAAHTTY